MMKTQSVHPYSTFILVMIATVACHYLNVVDFKKEKQSGLDLPAASVAGGRLHLAVWLPPPAGSTDARCLQNNIFLTS